MGAKLGDDNYEHPLCLQKVSLSPSSNSPKAFSFISTFGPRLPPMLEDCLLQAYYTFEPVNSYGYSNQMGHWTSNFRLLWTITLNPPPLAPDARLCPPPPLGPAGFCSMTRLHALPLFQTLLWKMGDWEPYDVENAPLPISHFSHCHPPKETTKLRAY